MADGPTRGSPGWLEGRRLGGFELREQLGEGAFASVWRARQLRLGRDVAVKVLDPVVARSPGAARRFEREGRAAASLDHPAIVPVYEAGEDDGVVYLAMRLVDGQTLADVLATAAPLPTPAVLEIIEPVAAALDHAHAHGLVHRDVKPSNILLEGEEPSRRVWLADFGIAATAQDIGRYTTGAIGTAAYMAPEQGRGEELDHRADLYALGCVVHECLTGHPPFERNDLLATLSAHATEPVTPTGNAAVDAFFGRALAKDPAARYGSGAELLAALRDALEGRVTTELPAPPTLDLPGPAPAHEARRRWPVVAVAALAAFVIAAGLLAFVAAGGDDDDASAPPSTEAAPATASGGTVVLGSAAVIEDLNPHRYLSAEAFVSGNVLPPLYELDEELAWRPFLADGEPEIVSTAPLRVRYRLRDDATWDDGTPITSADVARTLLYLRDPASAAQVTQLFDPIVALTQEGDTSFTVELSHPMGDFRALFSLLHPVIKASSLDEYLADGGDPATYLSTSIDYSGGPFRVVGFVPGSEVRFVRNDEWWGEAAPLDRITVREAPTNREAVDGVSSGDADAIYVANPDQDDLTRAQELEDAEVIAAPGLFQYGLLFNLAAPPLDDERIRRAIALSLDRRAIADAVATGLEDASPPGSYVFFPAQPGYADQLAALELDLDEADRLLRDAGFGVENPLTLELLFPDDSPHRTRITAFVLLVTEHLADAGITVVSRPVPLTERDELVRAGEFDVVVSTAIFSPDPTLAAELYSGEGAFNFGSFDDPEATALLEQAAADTDPEARIAAFAEADARLAATLPGLPMVQLPTLVVTDTRLRNVTVNAHRAGPLLYARNWAFAD